MRKTTTTCSFSYAESRLKKKKTNTNVIWGCHLKEGWEQKERVKKR